MRSGDSTPTPIEVKEGLNLLQSVGKMCEGETGEFGGAGGSGPGGGVVRGEYVTGDRC